MKLATNNKKFLIGLIALLVLLGAYILLTVGRMFAPTPASRSVEPTGGLWTAAKDVETKLKEEEDYRMLAVLPDPDAPKVLLVTGDVPGDADLSLLESRLKELLPSQEFRVDVHPLR